MIEPPPDLVGMEDIMEVIYSFRCKFCSFTAHSPHVSTVSSLAVPSDFQANLQ